MSKCSRNTFAVIATIAMAGVCSVPTQADPSCDALTADFDALRSSVDAELGIALAPVGDGSPPIELGDWRTGPAWSTIKVPLTLAALRAPGSRGVTPEIVSAITESDNAAAEVIWSGLGDPVSAAGAVQAVLREAGDDTTVVQWMQNRPPFSAFGQTQWSLSDQSRFLARAACDDRDSPVLDLMSQIAPDQRWGVGSISDARFKGGWGPSEQGAYLVRQIALVPTSGGLTAVAVAAGPRSGTFEDGIASLDRVAQWLNTHLAALPAGTCPP